MGEVSFKISQEGLSEWGLNKIYSGIHWKVRSEHADFWHRLVQAELMSQKAPKMPFPGQVWVKFRFNTGMDIDNHGYLVKLIIDGMKGYLIQDDDRKHVSGFSVGFHAGNDILIQVVEME